MVFSPNPDPNPNLKGPTEEGMIEKAVNYNKGKQISWNY